MPVHNSRANLFTAALESLLAQDVGDFEIIISDNASDAQAEALYRGAARRDSRIRYMRHSKPMAPGDNFRFTCKEASGDFFFWAADDDIRAPTFVGETLDLFRDRPASVLVGCGVAYIDENGARVGNVDFHPDADHPSVVRRVTTLRQPGFYMDIYGMYRREALSRLDCIRWDIWGWDSVIVFEMLLKGPIARVDRELLRYRVRANHHGESLARFLIEKGEGDRDPRMGWESDRADEIAGALRRADLPPIDKLLSWVVMSVTLRRSPYVDERRRLMRYRFNNAVNAGAYWQALDAATRYAVLSPLAPFRRSAWKAALNWLKD
jgi:glycosyltransferase involved in cell wall biosynthesis